MTTTPSDHRHEGEGTVNTDTQAELITADPSQIILEDNIRDDAPLDTAFLDSIRESGVLHPCLGYRNNAGQVVVRDGKSRVLAAREVGTPSIPVMITSRATTEQARVIEQFVSNERRIALTTGEKVAAFRALELDGMTVAAIAKATASDKATVKASIQVSKSTAATDAMTSLPLTLDEALIFAEFENDAEALSDLAEIAESDPADLPHYAEQIRQDRASQAKYAEVTAAYEAQGMRVVTSWDGVRHISELTDAKPEDETRNRLDPEAHKACPGHAIHLVVYRGGQDTRETVVCSEPNRHQSLWGSSYGRQAGPMTDEQKAERKELIANNKAWDAAEVIRREWVASLLSRKSLPKDAAAFAAVTLTKHLYTVKNDAQDWAHTFLDVKRTYNGRGDNALAQLVIDHPAKAEYVTLAIALSAFENAANREWHRQKPAEAAAYLTQLADWGYHLSPVERLAAGITE